VSLYVPLSKRTLYATAPEEVLEAALDRFGAALTSEWRAVATDHPGIASAVDDVLELIRTRRREIDPGRRARVDRQEDGHSVVCGNGAIQGLDSA
jgi:hypothetical protein